MWNFLRRSLWLAHWLEVFIYVDSASNLYVAGASYHTMGSTSITGSDEDGFLYVMAPDGYPTEPPTTAPVPNPTEAPTPAPTHVPSSRPSNVPSRQPSSKPSGAPSTSPSAFSNSYSILKSLSILL